jgi:hypothetical protein
MTDEVKHLLGGYATGTLTQEENSALMQAALKDQEIFDAMADDETLRRYLAEPSFRQDLLKATAPRTHRKRWIAGLSGLSAAAACLIAALLWMSRPGPVATPVQMAAVRQPLRLEPAPSPAKPGPAKAAARRAPAPAAIANKVQPVPAVPPATEVLAQQLNTDAAAVNGAVSSQSRSGINAGAQAFAPRSANSVAMLMVPRAAPGPFTAHITDINAAILTLDAGLNAGVKTGDHLAILHEGVPIGEIVITSANPAFSVGRYAGTTAPQIGDTAAPPKK